MLIWTCLYILLDLGASNLCVFFLRPRPTEGYCFSFCFAKSRAESSLLKEHVDAQAKELSQWKQQVEELEEKERVAKENVSLPSLYVSLTCNAVSGIGRLLLYMLDWENALVIVLSWCQFIFLCLCCNLGWRAYAGHCCCWRRNQKVESSSSAGSCSWEICWTRISVTGMLHAFLNPSSSCISIFNKLYLW